MNVLKYLIITGLLMSALVGCGSSADSATGYIESGKKLVAEGNAEKARLQFKNAIQIDPRLAEPYYQLALLDEKEQKWKGMFANLTTVEQLAPTRYDALVKLGQLYMLGGNYDKALEKANTILNADKKNIMAWVLRSSIEMKKKQYDSAMSDAEQALSLDANNIEALSVKTLILKEQGKPDQALAILDKALKLKPKQLPLTMIKLSIFEGQKDYAGMETIYRQLLKQRPDDNWVAISLAKLLNVQNRYDDAKQVLEEFVATHEKDEKAKILLVSLVKTKEPKQAIILLDNYIKQDPNNYELRFAKVKLQLDAGNTDAALAELKQIATNDAEGNNGRKAQGMLANYDFQQGNVTDAENKVKQILAKAPEDEAALLLKARIEIKNKKIDDAVTDLRIILRNNPQSDQALVLLAQAYLNSGSTELAEDNFRQALTVNPGNTIAALAVANSLMKNNDLKRTEEVLIKALQQAKNKKPLLQALAQVRILEKDWTGSKTVVDSLRINKEDTALTHFLSGQISQGQEQYLSAIDEYKAALTKNPAMTRALQGLAFSYVKLEQKQQLQDYLKTFIEQHPTELAAYAVSANVYMQDKQWDKAVATLQNGLTKEPKWLGGYSALAAVYIAQNKPKQVVSTYQQGLDNNKDNVFLMTQLASAYERSADYDKAKSLYEQILLKNPDIEPVINNLASLLTDQFRSEENLNKASKLVERFKTATQPYYLDTYAWTHVQLGDLDKAQTVLERVVSLSPNVAVFNYHLAALYLKQGKKNEAKKYLDIAKPLAEKQPDPVTAKAIEELSSKL